MISNRVSTWLAGAIVFLLGSTASAQVLEPTPTVAAELGDASKMRLGVVLSPMPMGTFKGGGADLDAKFAFGVMPTFDFGLNQFLFVGLAPQFIFNVTPDSATGDAGQELDLRARVGGIAKVADTIRLFGYAAPGYSIVMVPNKEAGVDNPAGFVLGFAAGAALDLSSTVYLSGELGYQLGYQSANDLDVRLRAWAAKTNYLHIGVGLGVRL
jgi:hypothetical protein